MKIGDNKAAGEITPQAARQTWRKINAMYYLISSGLLDNPQNIKITILGKKYFINNENDAKELLQKFHKILVPEKQLHKIVHDSLLRIYCHHGLEHDGKLEDIFQCNISKRGLENVFGELTLPS